MCPSRRQKESVDVNELLSPEREPRRYELIVLQHPEIARASSSTERDRRVVDPPTILQLKIYDKKGLIDDSALRSPYWVVQALLQGNYDKPASQLLQGQLTSSASYVTNGFAHSAGCYFYFSDLAITEPGVYHLKYILTTVYAFPGTANELPVLAESFSKPIRASLPKDFPGMSASSELAKSLAEHSVGLSIRNMDYRNR
ncbi:hypothetical protein E3Q22_04230 [Wallemia mellicola]|uniref:Velvet domain-containing protein n=2 Tax=Wallemia mellicola TaxID=1708541 RepID=A0A4T0SGZ9_9BASI|nr:hypothetical protein WALSEDRAFT_31264 [Wallemia mellicola CBS 633.66]TIB74261.1 hypothetical protein E3Q22_04230 [Wallemia mellicola]EIM23773.1 hypothetical protein WALSEDRAFT_31264 [Wallemia mellicola CBS 633.66]TIB86846.1 hypothetical protein E3Q19_03764 [Wallemia mellicola]TIB94348.1 hypothetical protein E3Q18_04289 [Wallemia mellicola]TIC00782.1 hypothetical protein E3Q16_03889 [Wallemia mellicola]|eukprot:XP_006956436.1 hypothetical protein WALSEDRAFT_31264 [Wallemia mellicola CBS 633.66]